MVVAEAYVGMESEERRFAATVVMLVLTGFVHQSLEVIDRHHDETVSEWET
jgi:hypothetical protein